MEGSMDYTEQKRAGVGNVNGVNAASRIPRLLFCNANIRQKR